MSSWLKNNFIRSVAVLMSGTALSQIAVVLVTPVLTRIYGPEVFGELSVYLSILFTVGILITFQFESAIPLPKKGKDAINLLALSILIMVSFVGIVSLILIGFSPMIPSYFWYLPISLLGLGIFQVFHLWLLREEEYASIARGKVQMNITQIGGQTGLGFLSNTTHSLVIGEAVGRLLGGVGLFIFSWKTVKKNLTFVSKQKMKEMAKRYKRFPLYTSWSSLMGALTNHLPTFFVAATLGVKVAGWYMLANRVLSLPTSLLGYSVEQVYLGKAAKLLHSSFSSFVALFWQTVKKLFLISLVIYLIASICSPFIFSIIFGEEWKEAGVFVQCMSILFFAQLVAGPITLNFDVLELQHLDMYSEIIHFLLLVIGMGIGYLFLTSAWSVILCISIAGALGFFLKGILAWYSIYVYQRKNEGVR
ncbi:lipopolysaccharide biosynthesis protein [Ornithinibacillus halophilus]|uniref:Membrane protein involved in the export of O-antigen and teichoic acid n=1 Tax=Ornithinibacillus halophilus TaxID=930117 RepID=A0A1M5KKL0_9BACI|nr:oligosaccharide flippase family protein [Ornithinibacillus halophilus]SHG53210.1 Membrane protein involved in the export of O-antigen and teichoic acid [Ornithinibacillus halophilus]